jgi:two-component system OmpR family sensor kinase
MNIHSIFFKLNLFFTVALIATLLAGVSIVLHITKRDQTNLLIQSRLLIHEYRSTHSRPTRLIRELGLKVVPVQAWRPVLNDLRKNKSFPLKKMHRFGAANIIPYQGYLYLWIHTRNFKILLRQRKSFWQRMTGALMIFGAMVSLLVIIYWLLRRSLHPIRRLQNDIVRYGEGHYPHKDFFSEHQDEIAQVGNAFYASAHRTQQLIQSRQLFVRNIFHELNTPVTKGKILAELVDDPKTQSMLDSIFSRLASLLKELAQMEQITSQDTVLHTRPVRLIELIDQARDLLYLDQTIPTNIIDEMIEADFATMSIAFKNLIDNGRKYGKHLIIKHTENGVEFVSEGDPLTHPLSYYIEPFSAGDTRSNKGFGLGLYIVNEIAVKHGMKLSYRHQEGKNIFALG